MPLVRKPTGQSPGPVPVASSVLGDLVSGGAEERWAAARAAADVPGAIPALAAALRNESDSRVREAMFTSLARIGTSEATDLLISFLRSDSANLRAGALDALRITPTRIPELLPRLFGDHDVDVRILSCELARALPSPEATTLLCTLIAGEQEVNVCAAAIDVLAEVGGPPALPALAACAQKFPDNAFLAFAIKTATDRIHAQLSSPRA
jgi:HEAT repeat protein